jgi:maltose/moltooligosaccharide transporter
MQSRLIGIGATLASGLAWFLQRTGVTGTGTNGIPNTVRYAFWIGAVTFFVAVAWTVFTTGEEPPETFAPRSESSTQREHWLREILTAVREMPPTMRSLAPVQLWTWFGLFCMWIFFGIATATYVFNAPDPHSEAYSKGINWGGVCFAGYSFVTIFAPTLLSSLTRVMSRKKVHALALVCGAIALLAMSVIHSPIVLLIVFSLGIGIAWTSILSMPYAMLSGAIPAERAGVYMGLFNFFIVIPEIAAALFLQPIVKHVFHSNILYVIMLGGASLLVAAALVLRVPDNTARATS